MRKELYKRRFSLLLAFMMIFQMTVQPFSGSFVYADENTDLVTATGEETTGEEADGKEVYVEENAGKETTGKTGVEEESSGATAGEEITEPVIGFDETEEAAGTTSHNIVFYNYDGSILTKKENVSEGSVISNLFSLPLTPNDIPSDRVFKGWVTSPGGTTVYNAWGTEIYDNYDFYPYTKKLYRVDFVNSDDSTIVSSQNVEENSTINNPGKIDIPDHHFLGTWYSDKKCTTPFDFNTSISSATTIYGKWIRYYTVVFDSNAGHFNDGLGGQQRTVSPNTGSKLTAPDVFREGYTVDGWYDLAAGGKKWNFESDFVSENSAKKLYAHWKADTYVVSFNDGKTITSINVAYGKPLQEPETPKLDDYHRFVGWFDESTGDQWVFNTSNVVKRNMVLCAHFEEIIYTIKYDPSDKTSATNMPTKPNSVSLGGLIGGGYPPEKEPVHDAYKFTKWYKNRECTEVWDFKHKVSEADAHNGQITLYAGWEIKTYTITISFNLPEESVSSVTVMHGEKLKEPVRQRDGFIIEGWYKKSDLSGVKYDFNTEVTETFSLYAKWVPANKVTFETNGGSAIDPVMVISNNTLKIDKTTTRPGYKFLGWYEDEELNTPWTGTKKIVKDITLYAAWQLKECKVSYRNGDKKFAEQTVSYGGLLTKPVPDPVNPDDKYEFSGWFIDEALKKEWNFSSYTLENQKADEDAVFYLYAGWKGKSCTVWFISSDLAKPVSVNVGYGEKISEPVVVWPAGKKIEGWYKDRDFDNVNALWHFSRDTVTEDIHLYAKWGERNYTVTFMIDKTQKYTSQVVSYNSVVVKPKDPVKDHYKFEKWCMDEAGTIEYEFNTKVTSDNKLYAAWKKVDTYIVNAKAGANGKIVPSGMITADKGSDLEFNFTPADGYQVDSFKVDNKETVHSGHKYTLKNISANHSISVTFKKIPVKKYIISASCADPNGTIAPSGEVAVEEGTDKKFYFDPLEGYVLDYILVDGKEISVSNNSYIFTNVTKDHTIVAHFKEKKIIPPIPPGYHEVNFVVGGETVSSVTVSDGMAVERPDDPYIKGQIFQGWFDGNNKWNFSNPVIKNLTLTAKFLSETVSDGDIHSGMDDKMNISDPNDITMVKGQTYKFGEGLWTSTDSTVISVGRKNGVAKAKNPTNVPVTLTDSSRVPAISYKIKVLAPEISEKSITMGVGATQKISLLYADGLNIAWTSSNPKIASVDEGVINTKSKGSVKIYAWANGKKYQCSVKVTDTFTAPSNFDNVTSFTLRPTQTLNLRNVSVAGQKPNKLDWRLSDEAGSRDVNKSGWLAWDDGVCRVDVNGKLKAKACGTSALIGRQGDTRVKSIMVNVATIPYKTETYINVGKNEKLSYYKVVNSKAHWDATNLGEIVKLGNTNSTKGRVYGLAVGTSVVSCSYNGMQYKTTVHVENPALSMEDSRIGRLKENQYVLNLKTGKRFMLDMPGVTQQVIWTSSNKNVAFVDEFGMVEGRKPGNSSISAKINGTTIRVKVYVTE